MATREQGARAPGRPYTPETPAWPKDPPSDWLTYHLAHPGPGNAMPGDPNCVFDYKGRYHLHYIYRNHTGFVLAHVSGDDVVRWTWHTTVLVPPTTGHGMFSGTGFYTKEGKPAIIYHGEGSGRNWIQYPLDDKFDSWSDPEPVLPTDASGQIPLDSPPRKIKTKYCGRKGADGVDMGGMVCHLEGERNPEQGFFTGATYGGGRSCLTDSLSEATQPLVKGPMGGTSRGNRCKADQAGTAYVRCPQLAARCSGCPQDVTASFCVKLPLPSVVSVVSAVKRNH